MHPTIVKYREYIYDEIIPQGEFHKHPFYKGLIDFIIDYRSPVFFSYSEQYEKSHFMSYFSRTGKRNYNNPYIQSLYYIHEFCHMLFPTPLQIHTISPKKFDRTMTDYEYYASNETEILAYYRLLGLREKTFSEPILYDMIKQRYANPTPQQLYNLRKQLVDKNENTIQIPAIASIVNRMKQYKENNNHRTTLRRKHTPLFDYEPCIPTLSPLLYQSQLQSYTSLSSQELYERNMIRNCGIMADLFQTKKPLSIQECLAYTKGRENHVPCEEGAKEFYSHYKSVEYAEA